MLDTDATAAANEGHANAGEAVARAATPIFGALSGDPARAGVHDIDLVLDIPVEVGVELGRARMPIRDILKLAQGSIVELDRAAGTPVDVLVNGCLIAHGDVVVTDGRFGVRLTDIVAPSERMRKLDR